MSDVLLVIDDRQRMEPIVASGVRSLGLRVVSAADFRAAKHKIVEEKPVGVLSAVMIGDNPEAGFEFCRSLREHPQFALLPVLLATDMLDNAAIEEASRSGAQGIIQWPAPVQLLERRISTLLGIVPQENSGQDTGEPAGPAKSEGAGAEEGSEQFRLAQNILAKVLYRLKTTGRLKGTPLSEVPRVVLETLDELCGEYSKG